MRKDLLRIIRIPLVALLMSSCYYDNKEELYPQLAPCDTIAPTYSKTIAPIFNAYCTNCHGAGAQGGIDLRTYDGMKARIDRLAGAVNHDPGYSPMPKNSSKLDDCKLKQINKWISSGAPNN